MISHKYKCIFVHIPRCGGTSIEHWLCGGDWWSIDDKTKHLLASQAKEIYAEHWNKYFKFAFVRHPVPRTISCLYFADHFGLKYEVDKKTISFSGYHERFGRAVVLEHDYRFHQRAALLRNCHTRGSVYGNIIDEEVDFIGTTENINEDIKLIQKAIGNREPFQMHAAMSESRINIQDLTQENIMYIEDVYRNDMVRFGFNSLLPHYPSRRGRAASDLIRGVSRLGSLMRRLSSKAAD
jgi:hypothetical protein